MEIYLRNIGMTEGVKYVPERAGTPAMYRGFRKCVKPAIGFWRYTAEPIPLNWKENRDTVL